MQSRQHTSNHQKRKASETSYEVTEPAELMQFLFKQLPDQGRNNIKGLLSSHQVLVNDETVSQYNHPLEIGQQVTILWNKVRGEKRSRGIEILFEDDDLIVVVKEAGVLSIATDKEREQTAYSFLRDHVKRKNPKNQIFIVHRLDRDTSGVMLFAKSEKVKKSLQDNWKDAVEERKYIAITEGSVSKLEGTITSWLKESKSFLMYSSPTPNGGQKAVTHYKVLRKNRNYSMLEVELETGRKNQIRVHLQDMGHPILGDKKYGSTKNPIRRLGLHARVLAFRHPVTGEDLSFESEIPRQFSSLFH